MKVYLDDLRKEPEGWVRAYWPDEVIALLKAGGVTHLSLDHDLGDDQRGDGYDVVVWIEEAVHTRGFCPPKISIHSANGPARVRMLAGISSIEQAAVSRVSSKGGLMSEAESNASGVQSEGVASEQDWAQSPMGTVESIFDDLGSFDPSVHECLKPLASLVGRGVGQCTMKDLGLVSEKIIEQASVRPYFDLSDYMGRTWFVPLREGAHYSARVHCVKRSDHDRALHDHPWHNTSIVLSGGYWEVMPGLFQAVIERATYARAAVPFDFSAWNEAQFERVERRVQTLNALIQTTPGHEVAPADLYELAAMKVYWRAPSDFISRKATDLHRLIVPQGTQAWSLFVMKPKIGKWGFLTPDGWVHNKEYLENLGKEA